MKKVFAVLLALTMLLGCVPGLAEDMPAEKEGPVIPSAGDVTEGFEVKEVRDFPLYGAELVYFEHQKTGAKVFWIANDDTNRVFQLTFPTRPSDNTGLPHVFEHATIYGSEKYPAASMFFNVSYQTYQTYMNAYTTDAMTCYPLASLSEEQLLALADYYLDSCFHPLIMRDESIFRTQAWHYDLPDAESDMVYEGVVYSEMLGALTLNRKAMDNANAVTFPGAAISYDYGGDPEFIPEMTWDDVKNYHDKYYHPSNCIVYLYGRLENMGAFLKMLNDEFSGFEKAGFSYADDGYTPITESVTSKIAYPVAEGFDTKNQSVVYYYILCPGMKGDIEQEHLIDHVCSLLNTTGSVLQQEMRKAYPSASISVGREVAAPEDAVGFTVSNVSEDDAEALKALIDKALAAVAAEGFPQEMVDSEMAALELSARLAREGSNPVEELVYPFAYDYAVSGDVFAYAEDIEAQKKIGEENEQGLLKDAAAKWLTGDVLYTLTTTWPAPGEKEKADAALAEKLAGIKAGMSGDELQAVVEETNREDAPEDTSELMAKIKVVTVENLPEEMREYQVSDETDENGVRHIDAAADVDGVGKVELLLDAETLPQEDIHWMRLFTRLLGKMDTDRHTKEELNVLMPRYLYGSTFGVLCSETENGVHPYVAAEWIGLDEELASGYDLAEEILFHTRFTDAETLKGLIAEQQTLVRNQINSSAYQIMLYRALSSGNPFYAYYNYLNFTDYYTFLNEIAKTMEAEPETVAAKLEKIRQFFHNSAGAVVGFAGNAESIALNRALADAFCAGLDHEEREAAAFAIPAASRREAMIIDGNTHYNVLAATMEELGLEELDYGLEAVCSLLADKVLVPVLREGMGVYTPLAGIVEDAGLFLVTYRDPSIRETFDVYAGLPERISSMEVTQDELDGYIMGAYSALALPQGELTGAITAVEETLAGKDAAEKLEKMKQLKAVTPDSVKEAAELYRKAWEAGTRSTAGSAAKVNEAADLYDSILNPFGVEAAEAAEFTDVPEGSEYYDAVHFAVNNMMMGAVSDTEFGVDDPATLGELLFGLSPVLLGSSMSAEETQAALVQYGLMTGNEQLDTELTEQYLCDFLNPIGAGMTTDTPDHVMTRGELADLLMQISGN